MDELEKKMQRIQEQAKKCKQLIEADDPSAKDEVLKHHEMLLDQIDLLKAKHEKLTS